VKLEALYDFWALAQKHNLGTIQEIKIVLGILTSIAKQFAKDIGAAVRNLIANVKTLLAARQPIEMEAI
jgi:citrate lyase gamma subunit